MYHVKSELYHVKSELYHVNSELYHVNSELYHVNSEMYHVKSELFKPLSILRPQGRQNRSGRSTGHGGRRDCWDHQLLYLLLPALFLCANGQHYAYQSPHRYLLQYLCRL